MKDQALAYWLCCGSTDYNRHKVNCTDLKYHPEHCRFGFAEEHSAWQKATKKADPVNHPPHYTSHPSGVECITITEHMGFNLGNALKYIWRADLKHDAVEDLRKARWYIERELSKRVPK